MVTPRPVRIAARPASRPAKEAGGCKIGELFRLLGEPHVLDILYLFLTEPGPRRFGEIQTELKMSPNTLSDRLRSLVAAGFLTRTAFNEIPPRVEYGATKKTAEFDIVFRELTAWADRNTLQPVPVSTP